MFKLPSFPVWEKRYKENAAQGLGTLSAWDKTNDDFGMNQQEKKPEKKMKEWDVTIQATITKTIRVSAENEQKATEDAHSLFTVIAENYEEKYNEQAIQVVEVIS